MSVGRYFQMGAASNYTVNWINSILSNGGAMPSTKTIQAVNNFTFYLIDCGLIGKMINVNALVPDDVVSGMTAIIANSGSQKWTSANAWSSTNFNINGWTSITAGWYMDTGVNVSQSFGTYSGSVGLTLYVTTGSTETSRDFGACDVNYNNALMIYPSFNPGVAYWDAYVGGPGGPGRINVTAKTPYTGYFSGNRVFPTSGSYYRASGSADSHAAIVTGNMTSGSALLVPYNIYLFSGNSGGTPYNFGGQKRFSFAAIHYGLTADESVLFFSGIQQLRQQIGGGFV